LIVYFDTSALIKLYVDEADATSTRELAAAAELIATSMLTYTEMRSAFSRKRRFGEIDHNRFERLKEKLETHWATFEIVPIEEVTVRRAGDLAEDFSLRGFDAVHLACAHIVREGFGAITFACFDDELARAASACGMTLLPSA